MGDPGLEARVAALRRLSAQDAVPAIQDVLQRCATGEEIDLPRSPPMGPARLLQPIRYLQLRFEVPRQHAVQEAAVVLAAAAAALPSTAWKGRAVLELGCGAALTGVVLAAIGSQVTLTDLPQLEGLASGSIALNARAMKSPGAARFCALDWAEPRASPAASAALGGASLLVAADPVTDAASLDSFTTMLLAAFGLDAASALCPATEGLCLAHKHRPGICVGGYTPPTHQARPQVLTAEDCTADNCLLRRRLADIGLAVSQWKTPPEDFAHPFVELWRVMPAPPS